MASFTYYRSDTHERTTVVSNGKQHARAKALIQFGMEADQIDLVRPLKKEGRCKNGNKPHQALRACIGPCHPPGTQNWEMGRVTR